MDICFNSKKNIRLINVNTVVQWVTLQIYQSRKIKMNYKTELRSDISPQNVRFTQQ